MSKWKKSIASVMLAGGLFAAASASAGIVPFYLAPNGDGSVLSTEFERLVITGGVTVDVDQFISQTQYTFTQSADFDVTGAGDPFVGLCFLEDCLFQASLSGATGIATLGGSASFTGGTITVTDTVNNVAVASFNIEDGGVGVDNTGVPITGGNNASSIIASPTSFAADYFFFDSAATEDFADESYGFGPGLRPILLNINLTLSDIATTPGQADLLSGEPLQQVTFIADGSARFEEVPAPATLALFGLGILGLSVAARRRRAA